MTPEHRNLLAYMRMLAAVRMDGRHPVRNLRHAVKGRLPWRLDCSGVPTDRGDDGTAKAGW